MLEFLNLTKHFLRGTPDESTIFEDFSFKVQSGEFISIIGSNGSGKTTLLNLACGSITPDSGSIIFDGKDITRMPEYSRAKFIGRVFQDPKTGTCPSLTILENMALADSKGHSFGLAMAINRKQTERYRTLLERCELGLENRINAKVGTLSGGQRQALALIIANLTGIKLLILDEHTAALDPKSSEIIMRLTDKLVCEDKITTMMVTHNLRFAVEYGSRLVMMDGGRTIIDVSGKEKESINVDTLLSTFNKISIEKGN